MRGLACKHLARLTVQFSYEALSEGLKVSNRAVNHYIRLSEKRLRIRYNEE